MKSPRWKQYFLLAAMILLVVSKQVQADTLSAFVDRTQVSVGETFKLSVRIDSQALLGEPDFSKLEPDFNILGTSQSRKIRSVNGKSESWTQWDLTLIPTREGTLEIPSFELKGSRSQPIIMDVRPVPAPGKASGQDSYLELEVSKNAVYVQEQLLVKVRLFWAVRMRGLQGALLELDNAKVVKLDENQYERVQQGRRYGVYEVTYAVFPQQSGELVIPAQRYTASLIGRTSRQRVEIVSPPQTIEVLPLPGAFSSRDWLPASDLTLTQSWSKAQPEFVVGEPVTRTLRLQVKGVEAAQLAPTVMPDIDGLRVYPEQPSVQESVTEAGYQVERVERFGMVPSIAGNLELPPVRIRWWDTVSNQERVAELPAETIVVLPAPGSEQKVNRGSVDSLPVKQLEPAEMPVNQAAAETSEQGTNWLIWTNLFWATIVVMLIFIFWRSNRSKVQISSKDGDNPAPLSITEKQAFKQFEQACLSGDMQTIRTALHNWLASQDNSGSTKDLSPQSVIEQLIKNAGDIESEGFKHSQLQELLVQLDKGLYGRTPSDSYPAKQLLDCIRFLRKNSAGAKQASGSRIPELY
ncbi:BatD family protein [Motiliproteus sp. MSK22-1]|uniref:BatD family protein n=1 Tax=Motiliproteus sp. MSK22-1 TaxID=1897630 RepID=UPI000978C109|nr:BatD family protein [Motiliproteus sp. MSK22-1]OMH33677.1 hypothetical protein BGP75_11765 [Motiliproteus sp. MSK22-1]